MKLDELIDNELIDKYEINNSTPVKFHEDLSVYYNFSITPILSIATEREMLNVREVKICQDYNINYLTFLSNLKLLTQYSRNNGKSKI